MKAAQQLTKCYRENIPFLVEAKPNSTEFWVHFGATSLVHEIGKGFHFHPFTVAKKTPIIQLVPKYSVLLNELTLTDLSQYRVDGQKVDFELHTANFSDYAQQFAAYQSAFGSTLKKAILSRIIRTNKLLNFNELLMRLPVLNTKTYRYLFFHPSCGLWLGATPELLLQSTGNKVITVSLAGTKPLNSIQKWGEKELEEQAYVTDYIAQTLGELQYENIVLDGPKTSPAPPVEHLKTDLSALHKSPEMYRKLLQQLHPTPAVCGVPKQEAKQLIDQTEQHQRLYYTGFLGWTTTQSSEFYVNLRCGTFQSDSWHLYVGGGITQQSVLQDEWNETELKAQTLLAVLQ